MRKWLVGLMAVWAGMAFAATPKQAVLDVEYVDADCFAARRGPLVVPAKTLLSQLL